MFRSQTVVPLIRSKRGVFGECERVNFEFRYWGMQI